MCWVLQEFHMQTNPTYKTLIRPKCEQQINLVLIYDYDGIIVRLQSHFESVIVDCAELYCFPKNGGFKKKYSLYIMSFLSHGWYAISIMRMWYSFTVCRDRSIGVRVRICFVTYIFLFFNWLRLWRITSFGYWNIQSFHNHTGYIPCVIFAKYALYLFFFSMPSAQFLGKKNLIEVLTYKTNGFLRTARICYQYAIYTHCQYQVFIQFFWESVCISWAAKMTRYLHNGIYLYRK